MNNFMEKVMHWVSLVGMKIRYPSYLKVTPDCSNITSDSKLPSVSAISNYSKLLRINDYARQVKGIPS